MQTPSSVPARHNATVRSAGYQQHEVLGQKASTFLAGVGTDPQAIEALEQAAAKGQDRTVELLHYKRNGSAFCNQVIDKDQSFILKMRVNGRFCPLYPPWYLDQRWDASQEADHALLQCGHLEGLQPGHMHVTQSRAQGLQGIQHTLVGRSVVQDNRSVQGAAPRLGCTVWWNMAR